MLNSSRQRSCWILYRHLCTLLVLGRTFNVIFTIVQDHDRKVFTTKFIRFNNIPQIRIQGKTGWRDNWLHFSLMNQDFCNFQNIRNRHLFPRIFRNKILIRLPNNIEENWIPTPDHFKGLINCRRSFILLESSDLTTKKLEVTVSKSWRYAGFDGSISMDHPFWIVNLGRQLSISPKKSAIP